MSWDNLNWNVFAILIYTGSILSILEVHWFLEAVHLLILGVLETHLLILIVPDEVSQLRSITLIIVVHSTIVTKWMIAGCVFTHIETNVVVQARLDIQIIVVFIIC